MSAKDSEDREWAGRQIERHAARANALRAAFDAEIAQLRSDVAELRRNATNSIPFGGDPGSTVDEADIAAMRAAADLLERIANRLEGRLLVV